MWVFICGCLLQREREREKLKIENVPNKQAMSVCVTWRDLICLAQCVQMVKNNFGVIKTVTAQCLK